MAFTNVVTARISGSMWCWETGYWILSGSATGTIYPATYGQGINGGIREIWQSTFWSDDLNDIAQYLPDTRTYVTLSDSTISSGEVTTGKYTLIGRMA